MTTMRSADHAMQAKIEALIEAEPDPRERARLMILFEIVRVLNDNVVAVREVTTEFRNHRIEFDNHVAEEQRLINQGRGMSKAVAVAIVVVQGLLGWIVADHISEMRAHGVMLSSHSKQLEVIAERHRQEERFNRSGP